MAKIGVFFSTEELSAPRILELAPQAERIGFQKGVDLRSLPPVER